MKTKKKSWKIEEIIFLIYFRIYYLKIPIYVKLKLITLNKQIIFLFKEWKKKWSLTMLVLGKQVHKVSINVFCFNHFDFPWETHRLSKKLLFFVFLLVCISFSYKYFICNRICCKTCRICLKKLLKTLKINCFFKHKEIFITNKSKAQS